MKCYIERVVFKHEVNIGLDIGIEKTYFKKKN